MRFYKINNRTLDLARKSKGLVASTPRANGEFVPNGKHYFDRIGEGEIIYDAPIFDYFHLQTFGLKGEWEWRLQDVHGFMGEYPIGDCWYISNKCKKVLEQFILAPGHHFYPTKLLYNGSKLDYWIFQYAINSLQNYNYRKSDFYIQGDKNRIEHINTSIEYDDYDNRLYDDTKKSIIWKKLVLIDSYDLVRTTTDVAVSEKLKQSIEDAGLIGFEFSDLDYEVVAE